MGPGHVSDKNSGHAEVFLILNQMAGPLTVELAEDAAMRLGPVAMLTGHPDTLQRPRPLGVAIYPAVEYNRGGFQARVVSWIRYMLTAAFWLSRFPASIPVLVYTNPPLLPWLAYLMRKLTGRRYAVMVHDIYPDLLIRLNKFQSSHWVPRLWRKFNQKALQNADVVLTIGEYMAATLRNQFDERETSHGQIVTSYPWADTRLIRPVEQSENWFVKEHGLAHKLTVMYSGNMGLGHDIETMISAAARLREDPGVHFVFIGSGPKWRTVKTEIDTHQLDNVTLLGWQPAHVVPFSLAAADIALVSIEADVEGIMVPSKAFSSLAAGSALALISNGNNEIAGIVDRYRCGWLIKPGDVDGLVDVIRSVQNDPEALRSAKLQSRQAACVAGSRETNVGSILAALRPLTQTGDSNKAGGKANEAAH